MLTVIPAPGAAAGLSVVVTRSRLPTVSDIGRKLALAPLTSTERTVAFGLSLKVKPAPGPFPALRAFKTATTLRSRSAWRTLPLRSKLITCQTARASCWLLTDDQQLKQIKIARVKTENFFINNESF